MDAFALSFNCEQRTSSSNPRSLVATSTEIYDYKTDVSSIGRTHCYKCKKPVVNQTAEQIVETLLSNIVIKNDDFIVIHWKKRRAYLKLLMTFANKGFKIRLNGKIIDR